MENITNINYLPSLSFSSDILYFKGCPMELRFDAKDGVLKSDKTNKLNQAGEKFAFIALAYRTFTAKKFLNTDGESRWTEIFTVNDLGAICSFYFRNSASWQFKRFIETLFYTRKSVANVVIMCEPKQTSNSKGVFYVPHFTYSDMTEKQKMVVAKILKENLIYNDKSVLIDMVEHDNYFVHKPLQAVVIAQ